MRNKEQSSLEIIEYQDIFGDHQQNVGNAKRIGFIDLDLRVDIVNGFIAKVADQTAGEARQTLDVGDAVTGRKVTDPDQGIVDLTGLVDHTVALNLDLRTAHPDQGL